MKPNLPKHLFWDVDYEKIDYEKNSVFVIGRALNFGTLEDIKEVFEKYGAKEIKKHIVKATGLTNKSLNFWSKYFNIPLKKFRCYIRKQSNPVLWNY